jgi:thiamine kinase-like enzyme
MASEPLLDAIKTAFGELNIDLQHEELSDCSMLHSKTNKFMQVKAKDGEIYLIRINGKLWPPFERPSEANNLEMLRQKKIKTNVIHNGSEFQICYFKPEEKRFSMIIDEDMKMECLEKVAESIKNYQAAVEFQNVLSIRKDLVEKAFNQMLSDKKTKLNFYYEIIKKIIFVVEHDRKDHVSSHNDLLPSDIYYIDGEIIIVDWEYSALNHPFYDLAHLSVLSSLTMEQDQAFLTTYNKSIKNFSIGQGHSFILMKAIISFLLLTWNRDPTKDEQLTIKFQANLQDVFGYVIVIHVYRIENGISLT